jgi:hypothetical protein
MLPKHPKKLEDKIIDLSSEYLPHGWLPFELLTTAAS